MQTVAGIFTSAEVAENAIERLHALGISHECINFLTPNASKAQLDAVPTTETEQPGMGTALGGVVGGAMGGSGSMLGAAVVSALVPGIGTITAIGLTAIALLGMAGGAVAGAVAGGSLENAMSTGLPKDELFIYKDALRQGRTVLVVLADDTTQAEAVREALAHAGAESLDAARQQWWVGMRDAEAEAYMAQGGDFTQDEAVYQQGFEAALQVETAGKPYEDMQGYLRTHYPDVYDTMAFRHGYARGRAYTEKLWEHELRRG